uniref:Uncharacterized protein n=1 Tax=Anguilla anguilla TaxID=7936 RepID=A0A0E9UIV9_ANGAN
MNIHEEATSTLSSIKNNTHILIG